MKKKTIFIYILLILTGLCVYFFVDTPMLNNNDETLNDAPLEITNAHKPKKQIKEYKKPENNVEVLAEKAKLVIDDTVKYRFKNTSEQETHIVALGDSLTEGVGDSTNGSGYVGILDRTFNKNNKLATFHNYGRQGIRTEQLLKRLDENSIITSVEHANIILITIGANDIMQVIEENFANLTYEQFTTKKLSFENQLQESFMKIRQYNPEAHIYLLGLYNPFDKYLGNIKELDLIVDDWNKSGQEIISQFEKATFIPIKDIFLDHEENLLADDNFHPNEFGYYQMAKRVIQYLSKENGGRHEGKEKYLETTFLLFTGG